MPSDGSQLRFLINAKTSHFVKNHKRLFQQNSLSNSLGVSHTNNLKKKCLTNVQKPVYVFVIALPFTLMNVGLQMICIPEIDWISDVYLSAQTTVFMLLMTSSFHQ